MRSLESGMYCCPECMSRSATPPCGTGLGKDTLIARIDGTRKIDTLSASMRYSRAIDSGDNAEESATRWYASSSAKMMSSVSQNGPAFWPRTISARSPTVAAGLVVSVMVGDLGQGRAEELALGVDGDDMVEDELIGWTELDLSGRGEEGVGGEVSHARERHVKHQGVRELRDGRRRALIVRADLQDGCDLVAARALGLSWAEDGVGAVTAQVHLIAARIECQHLVDTAGELLQEGAGPYIERADDLGVSDARERDRLVATQGAALELDRDLFGGF